MIIAFTGKKDSGKNTAASMMNYIANDLPFHIWRLDVMEEDQKNFNLNSITFEEKSFASKLKDVCSIITGLPRENFDNKELRDCELGIEGLSNPFVIGLVSHPIANNSLEYRKTTIPNYTYETLMQRIDTEATRDIIHQDIWVNALIQEYKPIDPEKRRSTGTYLDYSDCTFPN
jgi:hypothetical protein